MRRRESGGEAVTFDVLLCACASLCAVPCDDAQGVFAYIACLIFCVCFKCFLVGFFLLVGPPPSPLLLNPCGTSPPP